MGAVGWEEFGEGLPVLNEKSCFANRWDRPSQPSLHPPPGWPTRSVVVGLPVFAEFPGGRSGSNCMPTVVPPIAVQRANPGSLREGRHWGLIVPVWPTLPSPQSPKTVRPPCTKEEGWERNRQPALSLVELPGQGVWLAVARPGIAQNSLQQFEANFERWLQA